jgi:hypothetical protein
MRIGDYLAGFSWINRSAQIAGTYSFAISNARIHAERIHFEEILQECNQRFGVHFALILIFKKKKQKYQTRRFLA